MFLHQMQLCPYSKDRIGGWGNGDEQFTPLGDWYRQINGHTQKLQHWFNMDNDALKTSKKKVELHYSTHAGMCSCKHPLNGLDLKWPHQRKERLGIPTCLVSLTDWLPPFLLHPSPDKHQLSTMQRGNAITHYHATNPRKHVLSFRTMVGSHGGN